MSRHSTKNYKPRATGSLRHLMLKLKVFCAVLKTAPYRLNYSKSHLKEGFPVIIVELEGSRVLSSQIADIFPALAEIKRTFKCQFQRRGVGRVLLVVMSI